MNAIGLDSQVFVGTFVSTCCHEDQGQKAKVQRPDYAGIKLGATVIGDCAVERAGEINCRSGAA